MNIRELLAIGFTELNKINIDNPAFEAGLILAHVLKKERIYLYLNENEEVPDNLTTEFIEKLGWRLKRKPLQYITGKQEFMGLEFKVNSSVLIPRSDTEILVEKVVTIYNKKDKVNILDIGTGTGCIAISLAHYLKSAQIMGIDISQNALKIAQKNAEINQVSHRIEFKQSDLFTSLGPNFYGKFDLIVSNPPYIDKQEMADLNDEVKLYEPNLALYGGEDGLYFYRLILKESRKYLKNSAKLVFEIGYRQKEELIKIINNKYYKYLETIKDLGGNDRVMIADYTAHGSNF